MSLFVITFFGILLIYVLIIKPKICKNKIYTHINSIGEQVDEIEIL